MFLIFADSLCSNGEFQCGGNGLCISETKRCDGVQDCADNSDEQICSELTKY